MVMCATEGVFTAPSLENFLTLASGWLLCRSRRTTTGLIVAARALGNRHFSRFHALFSSAAWNSRDLWLGIMRTVARELVPTGEIVLVGDDTVQGKSGKKISGASNWRNACGSTRQQYRFLWGLNLLILGVAVDFCGRTFCLPINLRLYRKRQDCRRERRPYRTRSELMRQMALEATEAFVGRRLVLLVDGHYATSEMLGNLPERLTVITRLRRDAALHRAAPQRSPRGTGRPRLKGARLPTPEQIAQRARWPWQATAQGREVKTLVTLWYGVAKTHRFRLVVLRQDNPREPYGYFLCADPGWDADAILSAYCRRWSIEITIRDAKQHGGLGECQCRKPPAVDRQHAFTLAMMSLVMAWYMAQGHGTDRSAMRPWYRHKRGPTFLDMLAHARRQSVAQRVFGNSPRAPDMAETDKNILHYLEAAA